MSLPRYCQERQFFDYIFHQKPLDLISIFSLDRIEIGEYTYQRLIWLSKFRKRGPFP